MHAAPSLDRLRNIAAVATAVVGLAGGLISVFRTIVSMLTDRSLERHARKHTEAINESLTRLRRFRAARVHLLPPDLNPYHAQLLDDLQRESQRLAAVRHQQAEREALKVADPEGYRRWLLLYRPEGVVGWIIHSLFYGFVFAFFALVGVFIVSPPSHRVIGAFLGVLELVLPALYFRSAGLRRRHLKVLLTRAGPSDKQKEPLPLGEKALRWVKILFLWDSFLYVFQMTELKQLDRFTLLTIPIQLGYYSTCLASCIFLYICAPAVIRASAFLRRRSDYARHVGSVRNCACVGCAHHSTNGQAAQSERRVICPSSLSYLKPFSEENWETESPTASPSARTGWDKAGPGTRRAGGSAGCR